MSFAEIADSFFKPAVRDLGAVRAGEAGRGGAARLGLDRVIKLASNEGPGRSRALEALRRESRG